MKCIAGIAWPGLDPRLVVKIHFFWPINYSVMSFKLTLEHCMYFDVNKIALNTFRNFFKIHVYIIILLDFFLLLNRNEQ